MSEFGKALGQQIVVWLEANQKGIERTALLRGRLVHWAGRYKSDQEYVFNDLVAYRAFVALAVEDRPSGLPRPGGSGWAIVANMASGGVDSFPDVPEQVRLAFDEPSEVLLAGISDWAVRQIQDAVTSVPGLVRWRGWWDRGEAYQDRDLVLYNRSIWLSLGNSGPPTRNGWEWLLSTHAGTSAAVGPPPPVGPVLTWHALVADAEGEMVPQIVGQGVPVTTRASVNYRPDYQGNYQQMGQDRIEWEGGRVAKNDIPYSEDFEQGLWQLGTMSIAPGQVDPDGGLSASRLTADEVNSFIQYNGDASILVICSIYIRRVTGTGGARLVSGSNILHLAPLLTDQWQRFAIEEGGAGSTTKLRIQIDTIGDQLDIAFAQCEDQNGMIDPTIPSEYVKTDGTISSRTFIHANGNTLSGGIVTEAKGADLGVIPRAVRSKATQNTLTYSYDLANAAWGGARSIRTTDQLGMDGKDNHASRLVDDASGGSNTVTLSRFIPTVVSGEQNCVFVAAKVEQSSMIAVRTTSFDVTETTWFDLATPQVGTMGHNAADVVQLPNGFVGCIAQFSSVNDLNGQLIVYLVNTDGGFVVNIDGTNSIIVGNVGLAPNVEVPFARNLPLIYTRDSAVAVAASEIQFDLLNHNDAARALYFELQVTLSAAETPLVSNLINLSTLSDFVANSQADGGRFQVNDGTNLAITPSSLAWSPFDVVKVGLVYHAGSAKMQLCINGVWGVEYPYDGTFDTESAIRLLMDRLDTNKIWNIQAWDDGSYDLLVAKIDELMA